MRDRQNGKIPAAELKEKSKKRLRVFALYLILAMVIVLLIWMNGETAAINIGFDNENVYTLRDGWTMERSQEKSLVTLPMDSTASKKERSEERRVGKECRIGCRSRWSPYH